MRTASGDFPDEVIIELEDKQGSAEMTGEGQGVSEAEGDVPRTGTVCAEPAVGEEPRERTCESFINKTRPGNPLEGSAQRTSKWGTLNSYTRAPYLPLECPTKHGSQQHPTSELPNPLQSPQPKSGQ